MDEQPTIHLEVLLKELGCPHDQCGPMAAQLARRAEQLASTRGGSREEALGHLLGLMSQGWAAQSKVKPDLPHPVKSQINLPIILKTAVDLNESS